MRTRLAEHIARLGITQEEFARRHGLPTSMVSFWSRAKRRPGLEHALTIERASGGEIPAEYWLGVVAENENGRRRATKRQRRKS